ncbi:MAG TPA: cobalamin-dependent protein, partial [Burkholderiales bacterium]|nr:cobalamin-dependent protein [Burkholderiales bacterium]
MSRIVLSTLNARYVHASLGLRYLAANLGELRGEARIVEFVLGARAIDMAEQLLAHSPRVIGFGVYIWNVEETTRLVALLKAIAPEVVIVVGGPEVSYESESQRICDLADYVVTGWGDLAFAGLCRSVLGGDRPGGKMIAGGQPPLSAILMPYGEFTEEDIARRFVYVEASRGCPFKCEFCLSSLDKTAWAFDLDSFMGELEGLHARGARHFRFVDRTFNLKAAVGSRILEFFLERLDEKLFVHFEVIPDHLPDRLKAAIARFPAGALQFEVGIQTWNEEVQALISRKQDNAKAEENLRWLRAESNALVHV